MFSKVSRKPTKAATDLANILKAGQCEKLINHVSYFKVF